MQATPPGSTPTTALPFWPTGAPYRKINMGRLGCSCSARLLGALVACLPCVGGCLREASRACLRGDLTLSRCQRDGVP